MLNARDSRWRDYGPLGAVCDFDVAKDRGAGVEVETTKSAVANARFPGSRRSTYRDGWLPDDLRS